MSQPQGLKAALKRGALITAANWPVVIIQFITQATFTLLLLFPTAAGVSLVSLLMDDVGDLATHDMRDLLLSVVSVLRAQPIALLSFLAGFAVVILGGAALTFVVKSGTIAVLVKGEAAAGAVERPPLRLTAFRRSSQYTPEVFLAGATYFGRRFVTLGWALLVVYGVSAALYVTAAVLGTQWLSELGAIVGWSLVAILTGVLLVWITVINLVYLLVQLAIVMSDTTVVAGLQLVARLLYRRGSDVVLIFVISAILAAVALAAAILATAGLGLISFVPFFGLAVVPLQIVSWVTRGLVFQYGGLAALSAYVAMFRAEASMHPSTAPGSEVLQTAS
ncbi:MAG: hypothetical protein U0Q12_00350 [Vicinamibacterales bacterium]